MQAAIDQDVTALATARWATAHDARLAKIMQALVRHLHDFAREVASPTRVVGRDEVAQPRGTDQRRQA